jgi:hypothetical protein
VVAGVASENGVFLVFVGLVMLALAIRNALRAVAAAARATTTTPSQQVVALLAAHAKRKTPTAK